MKKVLVFLLACFACSTMFAQTYTQHYQPVTTGLDLGPTNVFVKCNLYQLFLVMILKRLAGHIQRSADFNRKLVIAEG